MDINMDLLQWFMIFLIIPNEKIKEIIGIVKSFGEVVD